MTGLFTIDEYKKFFINKTNSVSSYISKRARITKNNLFYKKDRDHIEELIYYWYSCHESWFESSEEEAECRDLLIEHLNTLNAYQFIDFANVIFEKYKDAKTF